MTSSFPLFRGRARADLLSGLLLGVIAVLIVTTFQQYGISNDEAVQQTYGEMLLKYYASGFVDREAFHYKDLFYYGGAFDLASVVLERLLPLDVPGTRHLLSAAVGLFGIFFTWRLGRLLGGPRTGLLAACLITVTGAWYGAMFNHTKDIPFAAFLVGSLYYTCRLVDELPRPQARTVLLYGLMAGLALGMRVGGGIAFIYAGLGIVAWMISAVRRGEPLPHIAATGATIAVRLLPAVAVAFLIMTFCWPWSVQDPLNVWRAMVHFATVHMSFNTVLDGVVMPVYAVPGSYLPVYLTIKVPELILVGVIAALVAAVAGIVRSRKHHRQPPGADAAALPRRSIGIVLTAASAFLPVILFVITDPPAYDGIRHFLFILPPLAVIAALGLERVIDGARRLHRWGGRAATIAIAGSLALEALLLVRLHPYEYVYYNVLVGGVRGAEGLFVMDYWANTLPEATQALSEYLEREKHGHAGGKTYTVGVCADHWSFSNVAPPYLRLTKDWPKADFFIAPTHMRCDDALHGKVVYEVKRLDTTLAVVKDRRGNPPPVIGRNDPLFKGGAAPRAPGDKAG